MKERQEQHEFERIKEAIDEIIMKKKKCTINEYRFTALVPNKPLRITTDMGDN